MTKELMWLTLTIILTGLLWVPYIIDRAMVRGLMGCLANPSRNDKPQSAWAQRLDFAHTNAVENLIIFAPLVLILDAQGYSTEYTVIACAVYFWARLAHVILYTMGVPVLRTLAFSVGFLAQLALVFGGVRKTLVCRTGTFGDAARIHAARQQPEDRRPLAIEPRRAKCVRYIGRRVPDQQRPLKAKHDVADQRTRL